MGYVSGFSPDGKLFALLDSDGKLKIWNTVDNEFTQEYIPNLHLSASCRTFEWISVSPNIGTRSTEITLCIALGTSRGGVEIYSYSTNKIKQKLQGNGHTGAVTSICVHNAKTLYTSGEDCCIVEWSLESGRESKKWNIGTVIPTCIVSLPESNRLLVACKELKLWSLRNYKLKYTFTGHPNDVHLMKAMKFNWRDKEEEFVLTTSKTRREISLWKMEGDKKKRKLDMEPDDDRKNAQATFLMEHTATFMSCFVEGNGFTIAAVTGADPAGGGVVHLFIVKDISDLIANPQTGRPTLPKPTIQIYHNPSFPTPIPIMTATLNFNAKSSQNILIGYGNLATLRFENVTYNSTEKINTLQREDPQAYLKRKATTKRQSRTIVPDLHDNGTEYNTGMTAERKRKGNEFPMDELLAKLSLDSSAKGNGTSVVELLKQALQNHDANLLRHVFLTKDENVIRTTIKLLPESQIPDLVQELTLLAQNKTTNVQTAVCWLRILLQTKLSGLMALGTAELADRFGTLIGILQHKTHSLQRLSMLTGRLDLLLHQIKYNTDDDSIFQNENILVYEDKDESEEDLDMQSEHNSTAEEEEESDDDMDE